MMTYQDDETQLKHVETQLEHVETQIKHVETQLEHDETQIKHVETRLEPDETQLSDLLIRWEEMHERGEHPSIEALCAEHPSLSDELRRRVEALRVMDPLLQSTLPPSDHMNLLSTASGFPVVSPSDRKSAACSSTYRDLQFHAAGGLGEVFKALGEDLHRHVALKFVKKPRAHDPDSRRRFLQEAEITGRLEHPGIVPVYCVGQDDEGHPCYAMRFISGQTLEEAIVALHESSATPGARQHTLRALIKRLASVCNTIAYAHSRGVLHRDIKPKNIMLGKYDETLVVDWGLARPFDRSQDDRDRGEETITPSSGASGSETPTVGVVGTPAYMSPEQAEARWEIVGPASDVFSLGATLYAILTGRPPFTGRNAVEVLDRVRSCVYEPPRAVPRALEAICRKAMARRIEDRYASALDLADDLDRWLADEPVTAWREPILVRLVRWGRRHKTTVATLSVLVASALVAMIVIAAVSERQKREIDRQKSLAVEQHNQAEENFQIARRAVDQMLTRVGEVDLADVPQMEPVRERLLQEAKEFYDAFLKRKQSSPSVLLETGKAYRRLGDIREMLGDYLGAESAYAESIRRLRGLTTPASSDAAADIRRELARSEMGLGILLKKSNRFAESERALAAAIDLRRRLAAATPGRAEDRQALAESQYWMGVLLMRMPRKRPGDEQAFREALKTQEQLMAAAPADPGVRDARARSLNNLGMLLAANGRRDEAEAAFREALQIQDPLVQQSPTVAGLRWRLARTCCNLGSLKMSADQAAEAEVLETRARDLQKTLVDEFPRVPDYAQELAATDDNLGLLWTSRDRPKAEEAYQQALALLEDLARRYPNRPDYRQRLAVTHLNLGTLLARTDLPEAERACRKALDLQDKLVAEFPAIPEYEDGMGRTLFSLAYIRNTQHDLDGARRVLLEAIRHQRHVREANPSNDLFRDHLGESLGLLATTSIQLGDHAGAARAAEELPRVVPDNLREYVRAVIFLTQCMRLAASEPPLEESYAQKAVALLRQMVGRKLLRDVRDLDGRDLDPLRGRDDFQELRRRLAESSRISTG
jgi:serine/threonine protein kinase